MVYAQQGGRAATTSKRDSLHMRLHTCEPKQPSQHQEHGQLQVQQAVKSLFESYASSKVPEYWCLRRLFFCLLCLLLFFTAAGCSAVCCYAMIRSYYSNAVSCYCNVRIYQCTVTSLSSDCYFVVRIVYYSTITLLHYYTFVLLY